MDAVRVAVNVLRRKLVDIGYVAHVCDDVGTVYVLNDVYACMRVQECCPLSGVVFWYAPATVPSLTVALCGCVCVRVCSGI